MDTSNKPLVTAIFLSFNHQNYLDSSLGSLLKQDYPNLEIIVSDDCSDDVSFEIIKSMVNTNDSRVTVRRNETNLGIAAHINTLMKLAKGELTVVFAGDDISVSHRVTSLVDFWIQNEKPGSVFSAVWKIDKHGANCGEMNSNPNFFTVSKNVLAEKLIYRKRNIFGCSHAWRTDLFTKFGDLASQVINEDRTIPFRSALTHGIKYYPDKLVYYRVDTGISNIKDENEELRLYSYNKINSGRELIDLEQNMKDSVHIDKAYVNLINGRKKEVELMFFLSRRFLTPKVILNTLFSRARTSRVIKTFYIYINYKIKNK
jgi:glycosyltransferase involved in cell wall biosynthesis